MVKKFLDLEWTESGDRTEAELPPDPLDLVESILGEDGLEFQRTPDDQITFSVAGAWKSYDMWFSWHEAGECLQLCGRFGAGFFPESIARWPSLFELLCLLNQRVWFGHFELSEEESDDENGRDIVFRIALAVSPIEPVSMIGLAHMVNRAAEAMDAFFPAFDLWAKGHLTAAQALEACMFETAGEA